MSDYIKRADAKKEVYLLGKNPSINEIWDCLDALPSADAEPTIPMFAESAEAYKEWIGEDMGQSDLISRADAINAFERGEEYHSDTIADILSDIPSADRPTNDDLIIKNGKGIQDGLYNIKDGKLFKYKAKGGTVRTYPIVPSADAEPKWNCTANFVAEQLDRLRKMTDEERWDFFIRFFSPLDDTVSREEYEEVKAYMETLIDAFIEDGEELAESVKVVRCKDCIHWKADNEVFELGFCCVFPQKWVAETFYCADGERKEP